tara:strand:- start:292 stop:612 length:321 start_codon:yes stop_codon:yes gene_type:complete
MVLNVGLIREDVSKGKDMSKLTLYLKNFVNQGKAYVNLAEEIGIQPGHMFLGWDPLPYDNVKDILDVLSEGRGLSGDQRSELGELVDFWRENEAVLRDGFYGGKKV